MESSNKKTIQVFVSLGSDIASVEYVGDAFKKSKKSHNNLCLFIGKFDDFSIDGPLSKAMSFSNWKIKLHDDDLLGFPFKTSRHMKELFFQSSLLNLQQRILAWQNYCMDEEGCLFLPANITNTTILPGGMTMDNFLVAFEIQLKDTSIYDANYRVFGDHRWIDGYLHFAKTWKSFSSIMDDKK